MPNVQLDIEQKYCAAYDIIARSHGMSRRSYMTKFLEESAEKVPGLMEKAVKEMYNEPIEPDGFQEVRQYRSPKEVPIEEELHTYRFAYLDPTRGFIEGKGTSAGKALANAMGLSEGEHYDPNKYHEEFRAPQRMD